jgi:hypothetical protein
MQLREMGEQNETLRREHTEVCAAHEKLKGEQAQWREVKKDFENNHAELWSMLVENAKDFIEKGLTVKAMICKRCL